MNVAQRWRLKVERTAWRLDQPQVWRWAMWLVPLFFGLVSMAMRQDGNWDLRNYHFYNPFAWLNGKVGLDLAPAQMQSYFNPTIDLLYYGLAKVAPARVVGFAMGAIHGLNFVLLSNIAVDMLATGTHARRVRLPLLLAFAGMVSAGFIAQLGNTMGDNLTALFVLGALLLVVRHWGAFAAGAGAPMLLSAGAVMGLGVGLKLTNGIYAPALCLALLILPAAMPRRIRAAFLFGVGVLAGIAISGGHWYWKMWTLFGNPLFPQFNTIFHSSMAGPVTVVDQRFVPQGFVEKALWPFIFAMDPERVSEIKLSMVVWPILYVALIALACAGVMRRRARAAPIDPVGRSRENAVLLFLALAYLTWLNLFSIQRYLMPLELIAPLIIWIAAHRLLPRIAAGKIAACILLAIVALSLHSKNWGRTGWGKAPFSAEVQVIPDPGQRMVFTVHADPPMAWLATFYPANLAFASLATGFESDGFRQRLKVMMAERKGPLYVMASDSGASVDTGMTPERRQQGAEADAVRQGVTIRILAEHQLQFAQEPCAIHRGFVGNNAIYYRLCRVVPQS